MKILTITSLLALAFSAASAEEEVASLPDIRTDALCEFDLSLVAKDQWFAIEYESSGETTFKYKLHVIRKDKERIWLTTSLFSRGAAKDTIQLCSVSQPSGQIDSAYYIKDATLIAARLKKSDPISVPQYQCEAEVSSKTVRFQDADIDAEVVKASAKDSDGERTISLTLSAAQGLQLAKTKIDAPLGPLYSPHWKDNRVPKNKFLLALSGTVTIGDKRLEYSLRVVGQGTDKEHEAEVPEEKESTGH